MNYKIFAGSFILIFCLNFSFAQKLTQDRIVKVIGELKVEAIDSIEKLSKECEIKREKILSLIKEKGFDESFILGDNRQYLNEGMSSNFVKVPKSMFPISTDRDEKVVSLENTHVALFHLDLKLNIAKHILNKLDSINLKEFYSEILFIVGDSLSDLSLKKHIAYRIVENAIAKIEFSKIPKNNLDNDVGIISHCEAQYDDIHSNTSFIKSSFPYNGQYNLHIDDKRKHTDFGFFEFGGYADARFFRQDSILVAVYTNTKGEHKIVKTRIDVFYKIIEFVLPHDFLKRGELYKLQLALRPIKREGYYRDESIDERVKFNYYNLFKVLDIKANYSGLKGFSFLYTPIYFRTSIFPGKPEKLKNANIEVTKNPFIIKIKLDEPFDEFEIKGTECDDPVISINAGRYYSFWMKMKEIYSKRLVYYLKVPEVEHINVRKYDKNYIGLLDNTLGNNNIIRVSKSFAKHYIKEDELLYDTEYSNLVKAEIKQNKKVRKITGKDFKKGRVKQVKNVVLTIKIINFFEMNKNYARLVKKLKKRVKKRAKYFYKLHIVDSKRKKIKPKYDLQYYLDREEKIVNSLIGSDYKSFKHVDLLSKKEKLEFQSIIPHTNLKDYNITLTLDYSNFKK